MGTSEPFVGSNGGLTHQQYVCEAPSTLSAHAAVPVSSVAGTLSPPLNNSYQQRQFHTVLSHHMDVKPDLQKLAQQQQQAQQPQYPGQMSGPPGIPSTSGMTLPPQGGGGAAGNGYYFGGGGGQPGPAHHGAPPMSMVAPPSQAQQMGPVGLGPLPTMALSPGSSIGSPPDLNLSSPGSGNLGSPGGMSGMGGQFGGFGTKHVCAICGDRASGKHYGVYSCEGCKGFFKRTIRKDLTYACRDEKNCIIDKRQRNRCQYCRYMKCIAMGMKREAVQEERQRGREREGEQEGAVGSSANLDMPVERIVEAEMAVEPKTETYVDVQKDPVTNICHAADKQLFTLVEWAKRIPHFTELPLEDQVILLRAGWNELLIAAFSHRSIAVKDGILLATGLHVHRSSAHQAGVGTIFDRVLTELVAKMRELKMDKTELGCLRAIVLFNPDAKGLQCVEKVEELREKVYATLEEYCRVQYTDEPGRFAKLLLRLPALRSIGLKCLEHLFFFKLIGDTPIDTFLMEMLETPSPLG